MPAKAIARHPEPSQLDEHVAAGSQRGNPALPVSEHFLSFPGIGAGAEGSADMVQDNGYIREGSRQVHQFHQLRVI